MTFEHHEMLSRFHDLSFLTKAADMSRFMSRFVIVSNSKKSNISNAGVLWAEPTHADGAGPSRAGPSVPGPGCEMFKSRTGARAGL